MYSVFNSGTGVGGLTWEGATHIPIEQSQWTK